MSKFDIFTIDLRVILSIVVATGFYERFLKFLQKKNHHIMFKGKGGVGQRPFEQWSKKLHFFERGAYLIHKITRKSMVKTLNLDNLTLYLGHF